VAQGRILGSTPPRFRVLTLDFGIKAGLIRELAARGCELEILPANTPTNEVLKRINHRDGLFLSNGPGDPSKAVVATETVKVLAGTLPIFGVCMGHQVLAQALGGRTYKLKFGHRGCNQPVMNLAKDRVEISSHNHGYSVEAPSLPPQVRVTHVHLNDQSVEGLRWQPPSGLAPAFSVQYHPEASPGPHDSLDCFQEFIDDMLAWSRKLKPERRLHSKPRHDVSKISGSDHRRVHDG
jgi:carbamoyl-phosphate synthase small subunit